MKANGSSRAVERRLSRASVAAGVERLRAALSKGVSWTLIPVAVVLGSAPARAQAPTGDAAAARAATAEQLFAEGRALLDQGRYREACEKFELSSGLERSPGTWLNLGNCYESDGDLVRALSTFERAFMDAQQSADLDRRELWTNASRERIARLGRRVPQLTVRGLEPDVSVALDGHIVEAAAGALRVNPGHHVLEVSAAGKQTRRQEFDIVIGQHIAIHVPPMEPEHPLTLGVAASPAPAATSPAPAATNPVAPQSAPLTATAPTLPPSEASSYGAWPWIVTGAGAALLGASSITGLTARSKSERLDRECGGKNCDPSLAGLQDSARTLAVATDVLWITGAIAAGVGITLFVIDDGSETADTTARASCSALGCRLEAAGTF